MTIKPSDLDSSFTRVSSSRVSFENLQSLSLTKKIAIFVDEYIAFTFLLGFRNIKFASDKTYLRGSVLANIFWCTIAFAVLIYSIYLSFTFHWASFIAGGFLFKLIYSSNASANVTNLLHVFQNDKIFFETMKNMLTIYVHQDSLDKLSPSDNEDKPGAKNDINSQKIINDFGATMEKYDWLMAFYDISHLPHPKKKIKDSIISFYPSIKDEVMRGHFRSALQALTHFQEGIGSKVIRAVPDILNKDSFKNIGDLKKDIDEGKKLSPEKSKLVFDMAQDFLNADKETDKGLYKSYIKKAEVEYEEYMEELKANISSVLKK